MHASELVKKIDEVHQKVGLALHSAFAANNKKKSEIFLTLWERMNYHSVKFVKREEIDLHYETLISSLSQQIALLNETLNDTDKSLFNALTHFCQHLATQRFILQNFAENRQTGLLDKDVEEAHKLYHLACSQYAKTDLEQTNRRFNAFMSIMQQLMQKFIELGYIKATQEIFSGFHAPSEAQESILRLANHLPNKSVLSQLTQACNEAKAGDKAEIEKQCKLELGRFVTGMRETRMALHVQLQEKLLNLKNELTELNAICVAIKGIKSSISEYRNIFTLFELTNHLIDNKIIATSMKNCDAINTICLSQKVIPLLPTWLTSNFMANPWEEAGKLIINERAELNFAIAAFRNTQAQFSERTKEVLHHIQSLEQYIRDLTRANELNTNLLNVETLWNSWCATMQEMENILDGHLQANNESTKEFLLHFMEQHWGKMLLGLAAGTGAGLGLAFLLSFPVMGMSLLTTTFSIAGVSVGAGSGILSGNKPPEAEQKQTVPTSKWPFWRKNPPVELAMVASPSSSNHI